mmetsp:Transcript_4165/g.4801  ORF Transcript_4165/g.4801 Transcript_4165/m.4801 type:complete len:122 (-) Transcript_4165:54-419(-)
MYTTRLESKLRKNKRFIALSRHVSPFCGELKDYKGIPDLCHHYIGSHDAFMFEVPVERSIADQLDFTQDVGHSTENRVIWEFQHHDYLSFNPCEVIQAYHYHCSGERRYKNRGKMVRYVYI